MHYASLRPSGPKTTKSPDLIEARALGISLLDTMILDDDGSLSNDSALREQVAKQKHQDRFHRSTRAKKLPQRIKAEPTTTQKETTGLAFLTSGNSISIENLLSIYQ